MDASVLFYQVDDDDDQSIKLRPIHKAGNRANANILYSDSWLVNCRGRRRGNLVATSCRECGRQPFGDDKRSSTEQKQNERCLSRPLRSQTAN